MKLFAFAASLRRDSFNKKLLARFAAHAQDAGATVDVCDFRDFDMPLYDDDLRMSAGDPPGSKALGAKLAGCDGFVIAAPEYNHSVSGVLKNAIDWTSKLQPVPWSKRPGLLLSASTGLGGGNRGAWAARVPLELCGVFLYPDMFSLASAAQAFNPDGTLVDAKLDQRLANVAKHFIPYVQALKPLR